MLIAVLLAAPLLMLVTSAVERRHGAAAAGALGAAPASIALVVLGLGASEGARVAGHAAEHVWVQVAFALVFAAVAVRRGAWLGLLAGAATFAALSLVVTAVPAGAATAAAVPALLLAPPLRSRPVALSEGTGGGTALSAAVAFLFVGATLATARLAGPALAGTVGAFPALSTVLALLVARRRGRIATAAALHGMIRGLRGYLAFCLTVAATAPALGILAAVALGLAACALAGALAGVRRLRVPSGPSAAAPPAHPAAAT